MKIGPGESFGMYVPVPPEMAAILEDARSRGALDVWNGPIEQLSRNHFRRTIRLLMDGNCFAEVSLEFDATPETWWGRCWRKLRGRPRPMPDPRMEP